MNVAAFDREHLSDDEIDLYSAGLLPEDRVRSFEEHYLECRECLVRVDRVEALVTGLRALSERPSFLDLRLLGTAAAVLVGILLGWQLHGLRDPAIGDRPPTARVPASASGLAGGASWVRFDLEPALRDASRIQIIRLPPVATQVVLSIDTREAGGPGSLFDVSLLDRDGQPLLLLRGTPSAADGLLVVAVPAALLKPAAYLLQARYQGALLEIPFEVERPSATP